MAQLRLKQLDSVLTGSLQVSGSSGVTGSLSVSLTGSFAKITTNAGSFGTYAHAQADELLVYGSGSEVGMTLASNDISGSQYINFSKGDQDAHTQRVGYIKFKHGGEGGGSTGDRYLEVGIAGRDNSLNTILRLRNRFDLNNSNVTYNGKHALYGNGLYIKDGDLEVETNITVTHITASGNISASGTIYADNFTSTGGDVAGISFADDLNITGHITASGNLDIAGNALFGEYIYHRGDADTYIQFDTDEINFVVGAANMIYLNEGGAGAQADKVAINNDLADVDFQVKGDNEANLIRTVATTDRVGIGTSTPDQILNVHGNLHISGTNLGHITASGDINTTSGRVYEAGTSVIDHATAMAIVFGG